MKSTIVFLFAASVVSGCLWSNSPYDYMENWIMREDAVRPFSVPVDVIYVQDQLYVSMNALPEMQSLAMDAVGRDKFSGFARVFSPLVANKNAVWLEKKGLVASFFTDVPYKEFVDAEMLRTIKNRAAAVRYKRQWGREMPKGMIEE